MSKDQKIERKLVEFSLSAFAKAEYYCWKADRDLQEAREEYEFLKEHGKDLLASLMTDIQKETKDKVSEVALERLARAGEKWQQHRAGEHAARKKMNELQFKSRAAQRYFDCTQSGLSFKRAEMTRVGGQET